MTAQPVLTVDELAARWRVKPWSVLAMVRRGELRKLPLARPIRIPLAAVSRRSMAETARNWRRKMARRP